VIVVSDTSVLSGLFRVGHLHVLSNLFGEVIVPPQVHRQLLRRRFFGFSTDFLQSPWLNVAVAPDRSRHPHLFEELDEGEAEAIALATELAADWLLIDEAKGRKTALRMGLNRIGVLGILVEAKRQGLIPALRPVLDALRRDAGFRVAPALYETILRENGE